MSNPRLPDLMGAGEIARLLGVSRQRVQQLAQRPDWPSPVAILDMGKVWISDDIHQWVTDHRRPPPDAPTR